MFTIKINDDALEKPQKDNKNAFRNVVTYFKEYCNSTSIHGFRYFGESRTIWEKIWWLIVFSICLSLCILSILAVYKKWEQSPVIVTFATKGKYISNIPFPAITVCAEAKIKTSVFNYTEVIRKKHNNISISEMEEVYLSHSTYLCDYIPEFSYKSLNYSDRESFNIIKSLEEMPPLFKVQHCDYRGSSRDCDELFTKIITDEGICYTFNILDRKELFRDEIVFTADYHNVGRNSSEWSIENGYSKEAHIRTFPRRAIMAGAKYGIEFELAVEDDPVDDTCRDSVEGFRILFHAPIRFPSPKLDYIFLPYNRAVSASITPTQILTSSAVKNYPAQKRKCYFKTEKKLKFFRIYSQRNCELECIQNHTLHKCQCAMFYMPRFNDTRICDTGADLDCVANATFKLQQKRLFIRIKYQDREKPASSKNYSCTCLPLCADLNYQISSSQAKWHPTSLQSLSLDANETVRSGTKNIAKVRAYFVNTDFIGSERNELYGPTDFLANFGGLLGLFTGFSVLSMMEILYFLTIRLLCNRRLFGQWVQKVE